MNTDREDMAGDLPNGSSRRLEKRGSVSSEGKFAVQFSKKVLTRQDDLSEDSGSKRHETDTPSGLRTSRSRRMDEEQVKPKIDLTKLPIRSENQADSSKKP
jgi:hypothetical protein